MKYAALLIALPLLAPAQETATVQGIALDRQSGSGVPGVVVTLRPATGKGFYRSKSDTMGSFRIEGLAPGEYTPSILSMEGYNGPSTTDPALRPIRIEPGQPAPTLRIVMKPLATVEGRVLDAQNRPVSKVAVEFVRMYSDAGHFYETDAEGRYRIHSVEPGAYRLRVQPRLPDKPLIEGLGAPPGERWQWVPTYYPNGTELAGAQMIIVAEGARLSGFDVKVQAAPVFRVRGTVLGETGQPVADAEIRHFPEFGHGRIEGRARTAPDGSFEFPEVRAGEWTFAASTKVGETTLRAMVDISVPKRDVSGIVMRLTRPFPLTAHLRGLPAEALRAIEVQLQEGYGLAGPTAATDIVEPLTLPRVYPGRFRVGVNAVAAGHYVHSVLLGEEDVTGREIAIDGPGQPLAIVFRPKPARVTGTVRGGTGGHRVVLIDANTQRYIPSQSVRAARCDDRGNFALDGVPPGTWLAFAFALDKVEEIAIREAVFRGGLLNQARTFRLSEGEAATVDLAPTPWPY